ncbi:MAG: UDP-2,4-diacetamido-2,4,6-trideoxy-beta-L-altropyranose hydrolase [Deltaproteobacteria bacterium]|nr:MAG: UDP-2,4-diacetamido-2,4,6-trideoxy-beta-L-altropyranose hydrolase [Deltaproteobacteria bacterium]
MKAVIRADASIAIGSGHVHRCLSLALELRRRGAEVLFICRELPGSLCSLLAEREFRVFPLPAPGEGEPECRPDRDVWETAAVLSSLPGKIDWLIVDHYALDREWESALREQVSRIMVLDDLANRRHDCDLLLDQGFYADAGHRYRELVPPGCRLLLGPRYALLNDGFARRRQREDERPRKRLFVFFGGSDATNETEKVLWALPLLKNRNVQLDVVVGGGNLFRARIEKLAAADDRVRLHYQVEDMAALMAKSDIALGAGGTTTWERFCLGLPSIVVSVADNQTALSESLGLDGRIVYLGRADQVDKEMIARAIDSLLEFPWWRRSLSQRGRKLVDGQGCRRLGRILFPEEMQVRPAREEDGEKIFSWRNAAENRRFSFSSREISLAEHQQWFRECLRDDRRVLLIGERDGQPVGVLRYDFHSLAEAVISVYLVPGCHGQGLGSSLIMAGSRWLRRHYPACEQVVAEVLAGNQAGRQVFFEAGFIEYYGVFREVLAHGS